MKSNPNKTTKYAIAVALAMGLAALASRSDGQDDPPISAAEPGGSGGVVPGAYPLSRYEGLWRNSLFGPGRTDPVAVAAPSNLSLVGVFEVDGIEHAVLMDTTSGITEEINSAGTNASGRRLAKIESSPDLMGTRVQVERGGSLIWVGYNLAATVKSSAEQAKADRLRALQEKQAAIAAAARHGNGPVGKGEILDGGEQPGAKEERPRTVVLPSTIPVTARPE